MRCMRNVMNIRLRYFPRYFHRNKITPRIAPHFSARELIHIAVGKYISKLLAEKNYDIYTRWWVALK